MFECGFDWTKLGRSLWINTSQVGVIKTHKSGIFSKIAPFVSRKPQATTVVIAVAHVKTIIIRRTFVVQFSSWADKIVILLVG